MTVRNCTAALAASLVLALGACAGDADPADDPEADTAAATTAAPAPAPVGGGLLDPDAATPDELRSIPGIDSARAEELVAARPYATMLVVDSILAPHLSESERDTVYTRLWKPIDLNTASEQEILLIPGVGERMHHEFEEYRPYTSMDQFRREIGKYVDEAEVERLARYVEIR